MGMMLKNFVHPYIQSTTVLCDYGGNNAFEVTQLKTAAMFTESSLKSLLQYIKYKFMLLVCVCVCVCCVNLCTLFASEASPLGQILDQKLHHYQWRCNKKFIFPILLLLVVVVVVQFTTLYLKNRK